MRKTLTFILLLFFIYSAVFAQDTDNRSQQQTNYSESTSYTPRQLIPDKNAKPEKKFKKNESKGENDNNIADQRELIKIPVSVFDRNGKFLPGLKKEDLKIFVDDKEQDISAFETNNEPITVILLIDISISTAYSIDLIQNYALAVVEKLRPQDNVMVAEFDTEIKTLVEPNSDREKITKGIRRIKFGGGTSLYDSVQFLFQKTISVIKGQKVLIIMTDGIDTTSQKATYETSLAEAEKYDVSTYSVYLDTFAQTVLATSKPGTKASINQAQLLKPSYELGLQYLNDLGLLSGGRVVTVENLLGSEKAGSENVVEEIKQQYYINIYQSEIGEIGQRKQIKVRVNRPNLIVRAKGSYIVGGNIQTKLK